MSWMNSALCRSALALAESCVALYALAPLLAQSPTWIALTPTALPPQLSGATMAYDSAHGQTVLFGGSGFGNVGLTNGTWLWNGSNWALKSPVHRPPARWDHVMAYDSARGQVVLFGGSGNDSVLNDTWVWDGTDWTQKTPVHSPSARNFSAMADDSARGQAVLFGGSSPSQGFPLNDTWVWDGTDWSQVFPSQSPIGRRAAAMAYDSAHAQVVLFGGTFNGNPDFRDTWSWDGTNWKQQNPLVSPLWRIRHSMAYDSVRGQVLLFGGCETGGGTFTDTWEWNGSTWTQMSSQTNPPGTCDQAMAYDAGHQQVVLFVDTNLSSKWWAWTSAENLAVPLITTAVNGASFLAGIQNNSWISIRGLGLSQTSRSWNQMDFVNGLLPTALDGVTVTVNGKAAAVSYISPTQLNVLAPTDPALGQVPVVVTNANGTSPQFAAQLQSYSPGLFVFSPQSGRYAAATLASGAYLGPSGLFGSTLTTTPAKPSDTIVLYGTGCGMTNPTVSSSQIYSGAAAPLTAALSITIGGAPATVLFAGMSGSGLCQFNVVVPNLANGDQAVVATVGGVQTQPSVFVAVQNE